MARDEVVNTMPTTGAVGKMAKQILAQGTTGKWGGEGFGSAEKNAYDMAVMLAGQGFKNINDFGKVTKYEPVQEIGKTYNGQQVITTTDEEGKTVSYIRQPTGEYQYDWETGENRPLIKAVFVPPDAKLESVYGQYTDYGGENGGSYTAIDSSKVKVVDGKPVAAVGETFGNKKTGETINAFYDKAGGNVWGGTFAGEGSTSYGVQFTPDGKPVFYSQYGGSSNDFANLMQDLGPLGNIALAAVGGPMAVAAMGVLSGKPPEDILKSAALSWLGGQAGSFVSGTEGITDLLGETGTKIAANAAKQFVGSGGKNIDATKLLLGSGAIDSFFGGSGIDGPSSADFEEGYFTPGGEGFNVLNSDSTEEFLRSIGINSVDELTDSGLSNADIYGLVTGDYGDLSGLEDFVSAGNDAVSTDGADLNLASVDDDFPSTYTGDTGDGLDGILNSGTLGNIANVTRGLTGGTGGTKTTTGGTKTTTGGTGTTTTTGGTGTTTGGTGTTTTTGGTGTTTGGTTGGTTTGSTTTTGTTTTKPTVTTTKPTVTTTKPKTSTGTNVAKALAGLVTGAKTAKAATPTTAKTAAATSTNPVVDAITGIADQQQNQQTNLLNIMGSKDQLANIKSYKDLYGQDLFGDNYVPPSAGGLEEQGLEDDFFNGGHVNDLSVDALLHILRN
jgi:hypothetical protein